MGGLAAGFVYESSIRGSPLKFYAFIFIKLTLIYYCPIFDNII